MKVIFKRKKHKIMTFEIGTYNREMGSHFREVGSTNLIILKVYSPEETDY